MFLSFSNIKFVCNILTGSSGLSIQKDTKFITDFLNKYIPNIEPFSEYCKKNGLLDENNNIVDELTNLFNYVEENLKNIRGSSLLTKFVEAVLNNNKLFVDNTTTPPTRISIEEVVSSLNQSMSNKDEDNNPIDPYTIKLIEKKYKVTSIEDLIVDFREIEKNDSLENFNLINQTNKKCLKRIHKGDYSGAITVARTLLEQLTREIIIKRSATFKDSDDIKNLVTKCLKSLDFDVSQMTTELKEVYNKINSGFNSVAQGLGTMRNCMSDSHSSSCIATQNDAILAINASRTLSAFLLNRYCELKNEG